MASHSVTRTNRPELQVEQRRGHYAPVRQQLPDAESIVPFRAVARLNRSVPLAVLARVVKSMAHDFRHHLCTIYANAEFLTNSTMDRAEKEELLAEVRVATDCITDQLDSLLVFARTGITFNPCQQFLEPVIDLAIQMVHSHPETRRVKISLKSMPDLEGCVDGPKLCSAVFNLLLNACQAAQFTPGTKAVDISLQRDRRAVYIRVEDSGPGVSDAVRKTLVQPFTNVEGSNGSGLGLAIAKRFAEEHGGEIYLEESPPGRTIFVLKLPIALFQTIQSSETNAESSVLAQPNAVSATPPNGGLKEIREAVV